MTKQIKSSHIKSDATDDGSVGAHKLRKYLIIEQGSSNDSDSSGVSSGGDAQFCAVLMDSNVGEPLASAFVESHASAYQQLWDWEEAALKAEGK